MAEADSSKDTEIKAITENHSSNPVCRGFYRNGSCRYGTSCKFSHQSPPAAGSGAGASASTVEDGKTPCRYYFERGHCRFGDNCKFSHDYGSRPSVTDELQCITSAFNNISIAQPPPRDVSVKASSSSHIPKKLYMDTLNYGGLFFPLRSKWNMKRSLESVRRFVRAAERSGWILKVFFDDWTSTTEADKKWRKRREKEIYEGYRNMPQGLSSLFGDMFRRCGVEVAYASFMDCDDTIAYHAEHDGATVLSGDSDMFRYSGSTFPLFAKFEYQHNKRNGEETIRLIENHKQQTRASIRPILLPPDIAPRSLFVKSDQYLRGAPSPLLRKLNLTNPHAVISPLRHAMYHALKMIPAAATTASAAADVTNASTSSGGLIEEEWPSWSEEQGATIWEKSTVSFAAAEAAYIEHQELLRNPTAAFATFFPIESDAHVHKNDEHTPSGVPKGEWFKHCFACRSVTMEICSIMMDKTLLELMM